MQIPMNKRRSSLSSLKSFHSIDQFKYVSPFDSQSNKFPLRPCINLSLILLTTIQVFLLISSRIYLRGQLVRSFLSIYVDQQKYPQMFEGKQFYLDIINIKELKDHFQYLFKRVNIIEEDSFVDFFYKDAKFALHTQYKQFAGSQHRQNVYPIDPKQGIKTPFNMLNITDIQLYLLQVSQFQIQIQNLTMRQNWQGFSQRYTHDITYTFIDNIKIQINFDFRISNAMVGGGDDHNTTYQVNDRKNFNDQDKIKMGSCLKGGCYYKKNINSEKQQDILRQVSFRQQYIIRIRVFYGFVLLLALISLYLNYIAIRRTYKILYEQLNQLQLQHQNPSAALDHDAHHQPLSPNPFISKQQQDQIRHQVHSWVQRNKMMVSQIKLSHYFHILQFDLIFSTLSNIFEIITAFYLVSGIQKQRIAGITCMLSWMTIFKFVRNYKKLVLMYELIKVSIATVIGFFVQFLPVFISYALLGMCLFPKVMFFSSLANSVTTLVCLMMGDSIDQITNTIIQKNSILISMIYIFSFVLLFMHAIHNTLTSLIKQFFIIKKIELVHWQKKTLNEEKWIYIQQLKINSQIQKHKLPLKLTDDLMRGLLRIKALHKTKNYQQSSTLLFHQMENIRITQKWMIQEYEISKFASVKEELVRRSLQISRILKEQFDYSMDTPSTQIDKIQTIVSESSGLIEAQQTPLKKEQDQKKQSVISGYY